ncbi:hypothetical protein ACFL2H_08440 [Planctomycetota bacterium]
MRLKSNTRRMIPSVILALSVLGASSIAQESKKKAQVGLDGYCPVCVVEMKQWMKGSPDHQVAYDGRTYFFPGEKQKKMFQSNPLKYAPALGGDCIVCYAKMGKRMPGSVRHATLRRGRLYLFPGEDQKAEFRAHPQQYDKSDLAAGGNCVVCKVEMGHGMPGKPQFTAVHNGLRYQFPGEKQMEMFLANPKKYAAKRAARASASVNRRQAATALVSVRGTSGCAACDHGRKPLGAPSELGLAVNSADGRVFIVEGAHRQYPEIYKKRFDQLQLSVAGDVIKTDGKFTWINPSHLEVSN